MNMYAAIALSTGSKAKTRTADGTIIVVEMHYMPTQIEWLKSRIAPDGEHDAAGYGGDFGKLRDALAVDGVSPDDAVWLSVETPFLEVQG